MYKKILAAIDNDPSAPIIIDTVLEIGRQAEVDVVHVRRNRERAGDASDLVFSSVLRLRSGGVVATAQLLDAPGEGTAEELGKAALGFGSDLLVIGSRGHSGVGAAVFGSTGTSIVAEVDIPVLIVRGPAAADRLHNLLAGGKILVAVDGTEPTAEVVNSVASIAPLGTAQVVHARDFIYGEGGSWVETRDESEKAVGAIVAGLAGRGIKAVALWPVASDSIANTIVAVAAEADVDLVVVSSRRPSVLSRLVVGSVAHKVISLTDRPVLVAGRRTRVPVRQAQRALAVSTAR